MEVWIIAWPTVLTMTSFTVMQFVDKLMVGRVGPLEVAAQGNGGIWSFTPIAILLGFLTVVNTFVAQNLGAGRPDRGGEYAWAGLWIALASWLVVLVPIAFLVEPIFEYLVPADIENRERLVELQTTYARILLGFGIVQLFARTMHHYFFGMHRPKVIGASAVLGNLVNGAANYVLIFGAAGLPESTLPFVGTVDLPGIPGTPALGLTGAALGTVIGTMVEFAIPAAIFLFGRQSRELGVLARRRPRRDRMRDIFRLGWPAAVQYGNEIVCWALFMTVFVGTFGPDHMTAGWIALGYMHLSFMPAVGFSVAVNSIVGRWIGAGEPDTAVHRARVGLAMAMAYMTVCAVAFVVFRHFLVGLFVGGDVTPEQAERIVRIGGQLMICAAVFQTVDAVGIIYTGALRGAGDTVWPGIVTMILSWTVIVGGGLASLHYFPELESIGPWIAASAYIILYGVAMAVRFERGKWRSIDLVRQTASDDERRAAAQVQPAGPAPPATTAESASRDIAGDAGLEAAGRS